MANTTIPSELIQADVALSGSPTTTTQSASDNTTKIATTAYVTAAVNALIDSAPGTMNTLNEIAAALNDDAAFNTTVTNAIATKLPLAGGTMTGNITLGDNNKAIFGAGSDLQIYHSGTNSHIADTGEGNLYLDATNLIVRNGTGTETYMTAANNGGVVLYHDNTSRFSTTSSGIDVTGTATMDGLTVDTSTLVVDSTNNRVGIGLTNPTNSLEIQHGTIGTGNGSNNTLALRYNSTTLYGQHYMDANGLYHIRADGQGVAGGNLILGGDTSVQIWTGSTPESRVTVDSSGNVGIGVSDGDVTSDGVAARTYVGIIGTANRGRLNLGSTASNGADSGVLSFVNGANQLGNIYMDANSGSQTVGKMYINSTDVLDIRAAGGVVFNENSVDADFRVESNGNANMLFVDGGNDKVGIGTSSPDGKLHVYQSDASITPDADADDFIIEGNGATGMTIGSSASSVGSIRFADSGSPRAGMIYYNHVGNEMRFYTGATERLRIDSSGNVGIGQTSPYVSGTSFTSLSIGGTSGRAGLTEYKYNNDVSKGYLYAQSAAVTLESAGTNLIRFATNAAFRGAIDSKGTLFFGAGDSSYAHNTYSHAAVFTKNSTPQGTVVIEDSDVSSGVGNTVLRCFLRDQDPATTAIFIDFADGGGRVGSVSHNDDGGGVSYNTTSDYRLKENVNYDWDALSLVNQLKPAKFNFLSNPAKTVQGFLAHEVSDIVPSSVRGNKDHIESIGTVTDSDGNVVYEGVYEHFCKTDEGQTWTRTGEEPIYQQLDYSRIVPLLTKAIQEQQTIIDDLKSRIETLEG